MVRGVALTLGVAALASAAAGAAPFPGANGKLLVLDRTDITNGLDLFVVAPDGSKRRRITFDPRNSNATFSPDGRRIAYTKGAPPVHLFVTNADGTGGEREVVSHTETIGTGGLRDVHWAPDGTRLAYALSTGLYVVGVDSRAPPTRFPTAGQPAGLDWSPDGSELAYSLGGDIFVQPVAGGPPWPVVDGPWQDFEPRFSPDGARIAFLRTGEGAGIYVIGKDGRNGVHAGSTPTKVLGPPSWSPDGASLAFSGLVSTAPGSSVSGVWVAGADGSGQTLIRTHVRDPRFSPDGTRLLLGSVSGFERGYESLRPGVFAMNADGSCLTYVTTGLGVDWQPVAGAPSLPARCVDSPWTPACRRRVG